MNFFKKVLLVFKLIFLTTKYSHKAKLTKERMQLLKLQCEKNYLETGSEVTEVSSFELSGLISELEYYRGYHEKKI